MEKTKGRIRQAFAKIKRIFHKPKSENAKKIISKLEQYQLNLNLLHAADAGKKAEVMRLIKAGANINDIEPSLDMTPLMIAARNADPKMCLFLIQNGADPEKLSYDNGINAFTYALKTTEYGLIGREKRANDRFYTCLVILYMSYLPVVRDAAWFERGFSFSGSNTVDTAKLQNFGDKKGSLFWLLGAASAKSFASAFFDCIYG